MKTAFKAGVRLLKALSNEKRLEIVYTLMGNELNVTDLGKIVGLSQSSLSQHLAILRTEKIVKTRRAAQTIFYSVQSDKAIKLITLIETMYNKPYKM
ncbi:MAG: metalloregulator ArsR/SmtB family transcription factor [Lactobacillaceae bacterium]|jgi:DNA-binding transcriptional ArsR family regulator|nr:metalloregulator ArsR/SmtB family transcription factor [Lactobacillaceae bacterium]